ncbi:beta-ketoacyl-[acyl-carrier-protein] synthase family protein [Bacteroidales bacterium AH-315-I05]|nr:beta-ketoacyl-[acyl-carrier-protein] synthase family protein [Bacteroidales bacterium AH-315-I05]
MERVFVTGIGTISAIGNSVQEAFSSLTSAKSGIGEITILDTSHRGELVVAEVKLTNQQLSNLAETPFDPLLSRTALLGMIAAKEAIINANLEHVSDLRTGFISATSVGGMDLFELFFPNLLEKEVKTKIADVITHDCGDGTEKIADYLGVKGYMATISTACSSSANSIMLGARLIRNSMLDRVIAGGTDALTKFTLNGFNTLMILDREHCKPFDQNRKGLNLGEGAGFIVLESEKSAKEKEKLSELRGWANANDAYHQTASSPDGIGNFLAMNKALGINSISPEEIDYVNVHGTGTENNDQAEGTAIKRIFGENVPKFSSTKAFTGHTLGAAGGIEAVFSVLAIQQKTIFPNLNFSTPIEGFGITPETEVQREVEVKNVLSNSFGFGGNCSSLIFSGC